MNLAFPAFGQKTAVGRNLHVSGRGFFALSPPMGYKNLMCEAQRLRRRSRSLVFLPPPVSDRASHSPEAEATILRAIVAIDGVCTVKRAVEAHPTCKEVFLMAAHVVQRAHARGFEFKLALPMARLRGSKLPIQVTVNCSGTGW